MTCRWMCPLAVLFGLCSAVAAQEAKTSAPAANLRLRVAAVPGEPAALLDPAAEAWQSAVATPVLLSRTPRVFQTSPPVKGPVPKMQARAVRCGGKLLVRLEWDDATRNAPKAPPARTGSGGDPKQLYHRPTAETNTFADAAAIMVPEQWSGGRFPSLQMGDRANPVKLYFWNASRGAEEVDATGRATTKGTGKTLAHTAKHAEGKWTVVLEVPDCADGCPLAFAVWNGETDDRNGQKFFSIWYALKRE